MPDRVLFLAGAPDPSSINWETSNLIDDFTAPFARFMKLPSSKDLLSSSLVGSGVSRYASWRSIDLDRQPLITGQSQDKEWLDGVKNNAFFLEALDASFISSFGFKDSESEVNSGSGTELVEEGISQFYEHSFAVHDKIVLSSAQESSFSGIGNNIDSNATSTASITDSSFATSSSAMPLIQHSVPPPCQVSELKEMPNAQYLLSIEPQTMTVNLIVGIISASAPRGIITRHGAKVELIELLVGDETKSGLGINFWLPPTPANIDNSKGGMDIRSILGILRPQDIILLKNVAVSSFRGRVHGQSLRNGMTKVHLLYRNRVNKMDIGGCYTALDLESVSDQQIIKTKRVRDWVLRFVCPGTFRTVEKGRALLIKEDLPLDTQ